MLIFVTIVVCLWLFFVFCCCFVNLVTEKYLKNNKKKKCLSYLYSLLVNFLKLTCKILTGTREVTLLQLEIANICFCTLFFSS